MKASLAPTFLALALIGCANEVPRPDDLVKSAANAIKIGQDTCSPEDQMYLKGNWRAELHGRVWHVWFYAPGSSYGPTYETNVRANDGTSGDCTIRAEAE